MIRGVFQYSAQMSADTFGEKKYSATLREGADASSPYMGGGGGRSIVYQCPPVVPKINHNQKTSTWIEGSCHTHVHSTCNLVRVKHSPVVKLDRFQRRLLAETAGSAAVVDSHEGQVHVERKRGVVIQHQPRRFRCLMTSFGIKFQPDFLSA